MADLRANRPLSIPSVLYKTMYLVTKLAPRALVRRGAAKAQLTSQPRDPGRLRRDPWTIGTQKPPRTPGQI